tara:strand:+ start:67 stop:438 length:372 start_codon:yes stop_codon:yes gene_type:complete
MNEYILKVMVLVKDKSFYSSEVMEENYTNAAAALAADAAAADAAYAAALAADAAYAAALAADAAYAAYAGAYAAGAHAYWVDQYFERTSDSRADYDKEVSRRLNDNPMIIEMGGKRYKLVEVK